MSNKAYTVAKRFDMTPSRAFFDGTYRAQSCASEHGNNSFGTHWHVDNNAVATLDVALLRQDASKASDFILQLVVGQRPLNVQCRAVVDERSLFAPARCHLHVQAQLGHVQLAILKPASKRRVSIIEDLNSGERQRKREMDGSEREGKKRKRETRVREMKERKTKKRGERDTERDKKKETQKERIERREKNEGWKWKKVKR